MKYGYMQNNHRLRARADRENMKLFRDACAIIGLLFLFLSL